MNNFFFHHERFKNSLIRKILGAVFLRSMKGTTTVAWISGAFDTKEDWVNAGIFLQRLWLEMTKYNVFLDPFGSLINTKTTNIQCRDRITRRKEDKKIWQIYSLSYSDVRMRRCGRSRL